MILLESIDFVWEKHIGLIALIEIGFLKANNRFKQHDFKAVLIYNVVAFLVCHNIAMSHLTKTASWLLLQKAPALNGRLFLAAMKVFNEPSALFSADYIQLKSAKLFKEKTITWLRQANIDSVAADLAWLEDDNHHLITLFDKRYPELLKKIDNPPLLLYAQGDLTLLKNHKIAVVGSRNPTQIGIDNTKRFVNALLDYQLTIVSGMAMGIDGAAHQSALLAGGSTIAVCGTGLDIVYPKQHQNLAMQMSQNGLLLSEFSIGTPPMAQNFPRRNRVISGLSWGTLVVEATERSGSLISARFACEQGREVFAIPGALNNPQTKGPHHLIKQGAKLVENVDDIMVEISAMMPQSPICQNSNQPKKNKLTTNYIDTSDGLLLKYLSYDVKTVDELVALSNLAVDVVNQELMQLELAGLIVRMPGLGFMLRGQ